MFIHVATYYKTLPANSSYYKPQTVGVARCCVNLKQKINFEVNIVNCLRLWEICVYNKHDTYKYTYTYIHVSKYTYTCIQIYIYIICHSASYTLIWFTVNMYIVYNDNKSRAPWTCVFAVPSRKTWRQQSVQLQGTIPYNAIRSPWSLETTLVFLCMTVACGCTICQRLKNLSAVNWERALLGMRSLILPFFGMTLWHDYTEIPKNAP